MEKKLYVVLVGNIVKFCCLVVGNFMFIICWFKDGQVFYGENCIGGIWLCYQYWSFVMESVVFLDCGIYICLVENVVGSICYNYLLDVLEWFLYWFILQVGFLVNIIVMVGSDVELLCKVYSDVQFYIQWLKYIVINGSSFGVDGFFYV